jgi:hypothetical protein
MWRVVEETRRKNKVEDSDARWRSMHAPRRTTLITQFKQEEEEPNLKEACKRNMADALKFIARTIASSRPDVSASQK